MIDVLTSYQLDSERYKRLLHQCARIDSSCLLLLELAERDMSCPLRKSECQLSSREIIFNQVRVGVAQAEAGVGSRYIQVRACTHETKVRIKVPTES